MLPSEFYAIEKAVDDLDYIIVEGGTYEAIAAVRSDLIDILIGMIRKEVPRDDMAPTSRNASTAGRSYTTYTTPT